MFPRRPPIDPAKPFLALTRPKPSNAPTSPRQRRHPRSHQNRTVWRRKSIHRDRHNRCGQTSALSGRRRPRVSFTRPRRLRSRCDRRRPRLVPPDRPSSPTFPIWPRRIRRNLRGGAPWSTANKFAGNKTTSRWFAGGRGPARLRPSDRFCACAPTFGQRGSRLHTIQINPIHVCHFSRPAVVASADVLPICLRGPDRPAVRQISK
jgi:hypothetical protein